MVETIIESALTVKPAKIHGLGDSEALINVYMANRPNFDFGVMEQEQSKEAYPLQQGDIFACGQACGNGWRKVFNVYAKLVYAAALPVLGAKAFNSWQEYRDSKLLQAGSGTSLYFHPPQTDDTGVINMKQRKAPTIHILMGRTYAKSLELGPQLKWLDEEFAVDDEHRIIVSPYFDYRQLSNIKIMRLVGLIEKLNYCTRA